MPELPEVETVRRDLDGAIVGRRVVAVTVTGRRTIRRQPPAVFVAALVGRRIEDVARRGKYLLARLDDGAVLVMHLRMSGQLLLVGVGETTPLAPHTHVVIELDDGTAIRFIDPRTFGELFVTSELDPSGRPLALTGLGTDPIVDGLDPDRLTALLARRRTTLKAVLLDQHVLAGVGNLYADEICFRARLLPSRRTDTLDANDRVALCAAVLDVLSEAVELRGSTLQDARYRDLRGAHGDYQRHHAVYGREGAPCVQCGTAVIRTRIAGRSAHFCPDCQR